MILSAITILPLIASLLIMVMRGSPESVGKKAQWVAVLTTLGILAMTLYLWGNFAILNETFQYEENYPILPNMGLYYHVGIDGISLLFLLLVAVLMPIVMMATQGITKRKREYIIAMLLLETAMIGTFIAMNMVVFYIYFEAVLIPLFVIIGIWGGKNRIYATFKLFLYTFLGSLIFFLAMLYCIAIVGTAEMELIQQWVFPVAVQKVLWLAFFIAFAVKIPMIPIHTWLPDAHVEAPTGASVILAGVLLKFGIYGFLRFSLPMLPEASVYFAPMVQTLSIGAVLYTSIIAFTQQDMKKLIAYSSIAHMGYVTAGLFSLTQQGIEGAIFQSLSHGIVSGALFLMIGIVYDRLHTKDIKDYGGIAKRMPLYASAMVIFSMASVGLPGTSGFIGEFLILLGVFQYNKFIALPMALGMVLSATYMLILVRKAFFGEVKGHTAKLINDLSWQECITTGVLIIIVITMGIYPNPWLDMMHTPVRGILSNMQGL